MSKYGQNEYGQQQYGQGGQPSLPTLVSQPSTEAELDQDVYLQEIAFPLRFTENGDVVLTNNDAAINDSIKLSAFVQTNGIPLMPLGAGMNMLPFDPLDTPFKAFLGFRLKTAIELGIEGVNVDHNLVFVELENKVDVAVRYLNERTSEVQSAILAVPRFRTDQ